MPRQPGDPPPSPQEQAYAEGHKAGMELERGYRPKRVYKERESARRGGRRTGRAEGRRQGESEGLVLGQSRGQRQGVQEQLDRMSRSFGQNITRGTDLDAMLAKERRKSYGAGQADRRRAEAEQRRAASATRAQRQGSSSAAQLLRGGGGVTPYSQQINAPSFSPGLSGMDHERASKIIVGLVAASAVGVLISDAKNKAPTKVGITTGNGIVPIPNHLRNLTGVLIVGVIALVAGEFSPWLGVVLAGAMTLDVYVQLTRDPSGHGSGGILGGLLGNLGSGQGIVDISHMNTSGPNANLYGPIVAGGATPPPAAAGANFTDERSVLNWIVANPGKLPFPSAGSNNFYNFLAQHPANAKQLLAKNAP